MDNPNFIAAINQICDEKKINRDEVIDAVKEAFAAAYRRDYGHRDQDIEVILNEDTGQANILLVKTVVEDEKLTNRLGQLTMTEARQLKADIAPGARMRIDVTPESFGRIASQTAKQVILQCIHEAERQAIFEEYSGREDELLNAIVHHVEGRFVHLELDQTNTLLEPRDQIRNEKLRPGQRLKVYLEKVEMATRGPRLRVSRTHPRLVVRLLELEIPEVRSGVVSIKSVARDPGVRCKIIVASTDETVDPVGACVGQKGTRIQNITDELSGERIDVIEYTENFDKLLRECLSPARIDFIRTIDDEKRIEIFVDEENRALAIGKNGQNVRLASDILGWEIDVMNTADLKGDATSEGDEDAATEEDQHEVDAPQEVAESSDDTLNENKATDSEEVAAEEDSAEKAEGTAENEKNSEEESADAPAATEEQNTETDESEKKS